jgi:hypothetical protein
MNTALLIYLTEPVLPTYFSLILSVELSYLPHNNAESAITVKNTKLKDLQLYCQRIKLLYHLLQNIV